MCLSACGGNGINLTPWNSHFSRVIFGFHWFNLCRMECAFRALLLSWFGYLENSVGLKVKMSSGG